MTSFQWLQYYEGKGVADDYTCFGIVMITIPYTTVPAFGLDMYVNLWVMGLGDGIQVEID